MSNEQVEFQMKFIKLTDALLSLTNIVERHDKQIAALIEHGKETDERLNTLITVVEHSITKRDSDWNSRSGPSSNSVFDSNIHYFLGGVSTFPASLPVIFPPSTATSPLTNT